MFIYFHCFSSTVWIFSLLIVILSYVTECGHISQSGELISLTYNSCSNYYCNHYCLLILNNSFYIIDSQSIYNLRTSRTCWTENSCVQMPNKLWRMATSLSTIYEIISCWWSKSGDARLWYKWQIHFHKGQWFNFIRTIS